MFSKIVNVSIIIFLFYAALGVYTWFVSRHAINLFAKAFPNEHSRYFDNMSFNGKRLASFSFLWDRNIEDTVRLNCDIEKARSHARTCAVIFLGVMISFPMLLGLIAYLIDLFSK